MLSESAFPELPTTTQARAKPPVGGNASLRHILGDTTPVTPAWKASGGAGTVGGEETQAGTGTGTGTGTGEQESEMGKGRKGKGKQKQTLFTLGSFPT